MQTFSEAKKTLSRYVFNRVPQEVYTLGRMRKLMEFLGNPQNNLKIIHVAGTSGKGSTSYFISAMLKYSGKRVGLTVSPHVYEINERVQINQEPLPEKIFCEELTEFLNLVEKSRVMPSYFEIIVAFAYWYFAKARVDYTVVEVGLGGLLDATNVAASSDKVCVITDIGLDHTHILGKTIEEIARQKAGIILKGNQVFMLKQPINVVETVKQSCQEKEAALVLLPDPKKVEDDLPYLLKFQRRNWWLALNVFDYLSERDQLKQLDLPQLIETQRIKIPARMEISEENGKIIIKDGAHNSQKIEALAMSINELFPDKKIAVLLAFKDNPNIVERAALKPLVTLAGKIIVTGFKDEQDTAINSAPPQKVVGLCKKFGAKNVRVIENPRAAFLALKRCPEEVLLVTGSLYLMSHI